MRKTAFIISALLLLCGSIAAQTKVIAHRGYWNSKNAAQNSIRAMKNAHDIGAWGTEFDVHITLDGVVVVNHDDDIHGVIIEEANYADIKDMKLGNGEKLPTLRQYLEAGKKLGDMMFILEVKEHATPDREDRCVAACLKEVEALGLKDRVDYISFSMHACEQIVKTDPTARVYYLNGDATPAECKGKGFAGIDYSGGTMNRHQQWIAESHQLGMKVNVWTIDDVKQIQRFKEAGADFITTNKPAEALRIVAGELRY